MSSGQTKLSNFLSIPASKKRPLGSAPPLFQTGTPPTAKRKRPMTRQTDPKQLILDAGQKHLGAVYCAECKMVYSVDCREDVNAHDEFHNNKLTEAKQFRVTGKQLEEFQRKNPANIQAESSFTRRKVVHLTAESAKTTLGEKILKVIEEFVNVEFGFAPDISIWGRDNRCTVSATLAEENSTWTICCIIVREILRSGTQWNDTREPYNGPETKIYGVNRIWTHSKWRRKGLATALINHDMRIRSTSCRIIAFSDPTEDGRRLAEKTAGSSRYLVYSVTR